MLERQVDIDKQNFHGETPLCVAIQTNGHACLQILLDHGADHSLQSDRGRSILHEIAEYGDLKNIKILISAHLKGLKIDKKNSDGTTPLQLSGNCEEPPEWHIAFADLLASVDERPLENQFPTTRQLAIRSYATTVITAAKSVLVQSYDEVQQICQYVSGLPHLPMAVVRAILAVLVAVGWCLFR